jgi:predicted nucleic acid-binding protein
MKIENAVNKKNNPESTYPNKGQVIAGNLNMDHPIPGFSAPEKEQEDIAANDQQVVVQNPVIQLTEKEQKRLEKLEAKVINSVAEGWRALAEIEHYEEGRFWKARFFTFEDYVESKFDFNRKHSMRLVEAGRLLLKLEKAKTESPHPTRESHMREITQKLPESHHVSFWDQYCTDKSITEETISEVTAKDIKEAVREYRKQIPEDELPVKPPREKKVKVPLAEKIRTKSLALLEKVKDLVQELPERDAIVLKIQELEELLNA